MLPPSSSPGDKLPSSPPPRRRRGRTALIVVLTLLVVVVLVGAVLANGIFKPFGQTAGTSTTPTATSAPTATTAPTATPTTALAASPTTSATGTSGSPTVQAQSGLPCVVNVGTWSDGSSDWKNLNGALLNDGTNSNYSPGNGPSIVAPCQPASTANYAVETKIQVVSGSSGCFGISVRGTPATNSWQGYLTGIGGCYSNSLNEAYIAGPNYSNDSSGVQAAFSPGTTVHTYRVEANNNTIKLFVDGSLLLTLTDNRFLTGAQIGLWCQNVQLQVTSFQVTAL